MKNRWYISKEFEFDFGHRVWTQALDPRFSLTSQCVCKRLHGHRGKVVVEITVNDDIVNKTGMVTDFKHLAFFKQFIDDNIDHRTLIDINDPFILQHHLIEMPNDFYAILYKDGEQKHEITLKSFRQLIDYFDFSKFETIRVVPINCSDIEIINFIESFVFCNFVPTAENIAKYFYTYLNEKFKDFKGAYKNIDANFVISKVIFYETPKSNAIYIENV